MKPLPDPSIQADPPTGEYQKFIHTMFNLFANFSVETESWQAYLNCPEAQRRTMRWCFIYDCSVAETADLMEKMYGWEDNRC